MELRWFHVFIVLLILVIIFLFLPSKKNKYKKGSKIANTSFIKKNSYFKKRWRIFKSIKIVINICLIVSIVSSVVLVGRLSKVEVKNVELYNRDIILCMDVSSSIDELNSELVGVLKKTVNSLQGERFGISIFNTTSVLLVPLTTDYEYVSSELDKIKNSISQREDLLSYDYDSLSFYELYYIISGTVENSEIYGSSLIGDGLASCVYSFSSLEDDRTKIVILVTDNDLAGTPVVSLSEAADISKNNGVIVYGIAPGDIISSTNRSSFKSAANKTGGKYYEVGSSTVSSIVNDIEKTSTSLLDNQVTKTTVDIPEIPFVILISSIIIVIILNKKVNV